MRVLGISGSLRRDSHNRRLLRAAASALPSGAELVEWNGLAGLPAFDEDEENSPPESVRELLEAIESADVLLIVTPEYNASVPGALKNALDWLVGSVEFPGTAVGLLTTSSASVHAPAQLAEVLATMDARLVDGASATVALLGRPLDGAGIAADPALAAAVRGAVTALARAAVRA